MTKHFKYFQNKGTKFGFNIKIIALIRIIIILLYLVMQGIVANAQQSKYVVPGKVWEGYTTGAFHPPYTFTMHMRHDSILWEGKYYHPQVSVKDNGEHMKTTYWREQGKQVYRKLSQNDTESLIYDWSLNTGDTIFKTDNIVSGFAIVDSIETSLGTNRKKWFASLYCDSIQYGNFEIIEGIGYTQLEYEDQRCYVFETDSRVFCVRDDQGSTIILDCFAQNNAHIPVKQWVTSHKVLGSNLPIYTRYRLARFGLEIENKWELQTTYDRQGDNSWTSSGRVFFGYYHEYELFNGKLYKMFDYSLSKGDTFKLEFPNEPSTFMIVDSTDFVLLLDQREYKRLMLRSPNAPDKRFVWVEGVGDIDRFVFYRPAVYGTETTDYKLTCYYYNYNIYYRAPNVFNCDLKSASDDEVTDLRINIFPNPATDYLHLVTDESLDIEIRSMMGQRVKSISIEGEDDIDISLLEKGMYVLVFRNRSSKVVMSKLFVKL